MTSSLAAAVIERRFGGYRHRLNEPDPSAPERTASPLRVGVVGAGLAGLSAAALLAERGHQVSVFEQAPYLGGKLGGWTERLEDGFEAPVEHGFHGFFRHYYNLNAFLELVGAARRRSSIGSYVVLAKDGRRLSFSGDEGGPVLNLLGLARRGVYRFRELARNPEARRLLALLRYDPEQTFARYDEVPFAEFAEQAGLPAALNTLFIAFARAFFADARELSTAELIKSFHSYYLSHDHGLLFDVVEGGYAAEVIDPIRRFLEQRGAVLRTSTPITSLEREGGRYRLDGEPYDAVVVAAHVGAAAALLRNSRLVRTEDPALHAKLEKMTSGRGYAVWRLWLEGRSPPDLPAFVTTERLTALDAFAFVERTDPRCRDWAERHDGAVVELHSYALSQKHEQDEDALKEALKRDFGHHVPSLKSARVLHQHLQRRDDFTALHVGLAAHRPGVETRLPGLLLAGDWVKLPCPAMLMEAAVTSGHLAANALLRQQGVREYPVETVPLRGLLKQRAKRGAKRAAKRAAES